MRHTEPDSRPVNISSSSEWTSQVRRGVLELCILQVLRPRPSYGYAIVTTLRQLGPLAAGENTVYPLLRRLKSDGLLETFAQESPNGPPRQYYRLTMAGRTRLDALGREWTELVEAVDRCTRTGEIS